MVCSHSLVQELDSAQQESPDSIQALGLFARKKWNKSVAVIAVALWKLQ
jgi:hypothetical protein